MPGEELGRRSGEAAGVLIVEDEILVALDLEDIVARAGHCVIGIVADLAGLERLDPAPLVALVDLNLRDGPTGAEIARRLSKRHGTSIIFVTANPDQITDPPATALGYVRKPFAADTIAGVVTNAMTGLDLLGINGFHQFAR